MRLSRLLGPALVLAISLGMRAMVLGEDPSAPGLLGDDLIEEIDGNPLGFRSIAETLDYFAGLDTTREHVFTIRRGQESRKVRIRAIEMPLDRIQEWRTRRSQFASSPRK